MIKLYLDEDVHKKTAIALQIRGYDVLSAHEIGNWGITDFQQLEFAVAQGRAIYTFNRGDFMKLHNEYIQNGKSHFGIILSKQIPLNECIRRLTVFLSQHNYYKLINNIFWL